MECLVCLDDALQFITCKCGYSTCEQCVQKYILSRRALPSCMSCRTSWAIEFVVSHFDSEWVRDNFIPHIARLRKHKRKRLSVMRCECGGVVDHNYICSDCTKVYCEECMEAVHRGAPCSETALRVATKFRLENKMCPGCCIPIFKSEGCSQMLCIQCNTAFYWNSLEIEEDVKNIHVVPLTEPPTEPTVCALPGPWEVSQHLRITNCPHWLTNRLMYITRCITNIRRNMMQVQATNDKQNDTQNDAIYKIHQQMKDEEVLKVSRFAESVLANLVLRTIYACIESHFLEIVTEFAAFQSVYNSMIDNIDTLYGKVGQNMKIFD